MRLLEGLSELALKRTGVHIGAPQCTPYMKQFVERQQQGFHIINTTKYLNRLQSAVRLLAQYEPNNVVLVANNPALNRILNTIKFYLGYTIYNGHFIPGSFSNPAIASYSTPSIVFISQPGYLRTVKYIDRIFTRPLGDYVARQEAALMRVPVVSLCNTNDDLTNIDYVIPANNRGITQLITSYFVFLKLAMITRNEEAKIKDLALSTFTTPVTPP